jgi:orotate phosphoribosyltransferase
MTADSKKARLIAIVRKKSFSNDREITLASGRKSTLYFNMKPTMMDPEGASLTADLIVDALAGRKVDYVGGLEMGAVPIVSMVSPASYNRGTPIRAFFVRKTAKGHGTQALIEGLAPGEALQGKHVVVVEDVTTTGGSAMKAAVAAREAGATVDTVLTLLDRQEGAAEALAEQGLELLSLLTAQDFVS